MNCTLADIAQAGRAIVLPAVIDIDGEPLALTQSLRLLPGKRLVARAIWRGETVLAKLFFRQKNWHDENAGFQRLQASGLATPAQLLTQSIEDGGVVLYQFIDCATPLDVLWGELNHQAKQQHLTQIKQVLAQLQSAQLVQRDLHLGNFLLQHDKLWVIDPASVSRASTSQAFQQNTALFIAQLPLPDRELAIASLQADSATVSAIDAMWQQRQQQYLKKILRDCTDVAAGEQRGVHYLCQRQYVQALAPLLLAPQQLLASAQQPLLKDGNSAKVFLIDTAIGRLVVKQYINKDWLRKLRRALQMSRAKRSWLFSHALQFAGIKVPEPIAVIEKKTGPFTSQSWFISREQSGTDLLSTWQQLPPTDTLLQQVGELAQALTVSRISHGDMKATNFIVADDNIYVIDYDGCRQHNNGSSLKQAQAKDWRRLRANWPDNTELQRQLDNYLP